MKLADAILCARNDRESSLHRCGGPVKLVQVCLSAGKAQKCSFHHCG